MRRNLGIGIVIVYSLFFISHITSNGGDRISSFLWKNHNISWSEINELYFLITFFVYFLLLGLFYKANKSQKKVILLIVPITTMGSIFLLQTSFTGLFRYIFWAIVNISEHRSDMFLYITGITTLLLSFKILIKNEKLYTILIIIALNTTLLYFTYLAYIDILGAQTV